MKVTYFVGKYSTLLAGHAIIGYQLANISCELFFDGQIGQLMKHVVVRFSDKFGPTIDLHNEVALTNGHVWFGKMGTSLAPKWISLFESQINSNDCTWLYLVKRDGIKYSYYKSRIMEIHKKKDDISFVEQLPSYYADNNLTKQMACFFKIGLLERCDKFEIRRIRLASSGSPISEVLPGNMAGLFIVEFAVPKVLENN